MELISLGVLPLRLSRRLPPSLCSAAMRKAPGAGSQSSMKFTALLHLHHSQGSNMRGAMAADRYKSRMKLTMLMHLQ